MDIVGIFGENAVFCHFWTPFMHLYNNGHGHMKLGRGVYICELDCIKVLRPSELLGR